MSVPIGLAAVWAVAGIAATVIGLRTVRRAIQDARAMRRDRESAVLVASRLGAIDDAGRSEQEQMEGEFISDIEAWLRSRETEAA